MQDARNTAVAGGAASEGKQAAATSPISPPQQPPPEAAPVDLSEESVAGEEDPGAALDLLWPTQEPGKP